MKRIWFALLFSACVALAQVAAPVIQRSTMYAGTDRGLFVSSDQGHTWTLQASLGVRKVQAFNIRPGETPALLAASDECLFRSTDGGGSWPLSASPALLGITQIVPDPGSPDRIYAAGHDLVVSTDDGRQWFRLPMAPSGIEFAIDPVVPANLYSLSSGSVFRSTDGGENWSLSLNSRLPLWRLVISRDGSHLYGYGGGVVFRSSDRGASWKEMVLPKAAIASAAGYSWRGDIDLESEFEVAIKDVSLDPFDQTSAYVSVRAWWIDWPFPPSDAVLFVDRNGEVSMADRTIPRVGVTYASHPAIPGMLFRYGSGLDRSNNGGKTWERIPAFASLTVFTLLVIAEPPAPDEAVDTVVRDGRRASGNLPQ